jgi:hypothetical protein
LDKHADESDADPDDYRDENDYEGVNCGHDIASGKRREYGAKLE